MYRPKPATNEVYHIYNRGVEKRDVFVDEGDYLRFVHDLFEFNDIAPAPSLAYHSNKSKEVGLPKKRREPRKLLVELLIFCLMPNHYHLLVKQMVENGITEFMRKLGTGYTNYFNLKYERVGSLFQGKYKLAHVTAHSHFLHLPYYIHCNPLDLIMPEWRERKLSDYRGALRFLENYRWSSFQDYIGKKNFPSVTQREFLFEIFGGPEKYKKAMLQWLKEMDLEQMQEIILE